MYNSYEEWHRGNGFSTSTFDSPVMKQRYQGYRREQNKPAGKYHPPKKMKKDSFLKMERYDNTPMMELQKGLFQHGHI